MMALERKAVRKTATKKKNSGARKYKSAEKLTEVCEAYFTECDDCGRLYGEAGLALALGVTRDTLRGWYDGRHAPDLQEAVQMAYLRIQDQAESHPAYQEKSMITKSMFLLKQPRLGAYQEKAEAKQDIRVQVKFGDGMSEEDFA